MSRTASIARHSFTYLLGSITVLICTLILLPLYTHALTPKDYGLLETVLRFVGVCVSVAYMGLRNAYVRLYFERQTESTRQILSATTLLAHFVVGITLILPTIALLSILGRRFGLEFLDAKAVGLIALWVIFEAVYMIALTWLQVNYRSLAIVSLQVVRQLLSIALIFTTLHVFHLGLSGAVFASFSVSLLTGAAGCWYFYRRNRQAFSKDDFRQLTSYALPYLPTAAFSYIITNADRFALLAAGAVMSLGILSLASRIGDLALNLFADPVERVWSPTAFATHDKPDGAKTIGRLFTQYTAFFGLLAIGISVASPILVRLLATPEYEFAATLVPIFAIGWVFTMLAALCDIGILIAKKTKLKPIVSGVSAAIAVVLQLVLTPIWGIVGAAMGTVITNAATFVINRTLGRKFFQFAVRPADFVWITLGGGTALLTGLAIGRIGNSVWWDVLASGCATAVYAIVLHCSKIVTLQQLIGLVKLLLGKKA